ncbi:MAG: Rne/Rng family ribonuclease [Bryobacteraceae bacterium]|jgi:ribonuclease G
MSKELVISATRHETRVAILEDDQVVEVYHQRENEYSLAGSIHKGRVTRVLPGMQSAFVDIGLDRDAFLYVSDFFEDNEEYDKIVTSVEDKVLKLDRGPQGGAPGGAPPAGVPAATDEEAEAPGAVVELAAPAAPPSGIPIADPRRDDRDQHGRRPRRRRGQKGGGRGLPESKFFSPRPGGAPGPQGMPMPPEAPELPREPQPPVTAPTEAEDFFVLPGETLAKHRRQAWEEAEPPVEEQIEEGQVEDLSHEPDVAPTAERPVRVLPPVFFTSQEPADMEAPAEPVAEAAVAPVSWEPEVADERAPESETAEEVEAAPADELESAEVIEPPAEPAERLEAVEPETIVEEEGPEPARIPTSLTAKLREQGPRYLHRISRRTRRKGRDGRPLPEGPRAPQYEPRPQERVPEQRTAPGSGSVPSGAPAGRPEKAPGPSISELLKEGQEIIVQIAKEPLGQKGARITSHIALPGRFLVYMPTVDHIGVSRKIPGDDERARLKRILQNNRAGISGGYIVRTAGEGRSEEELRADMMFLYNLWLDMRQKAERRPAPALIHHDLNVVERVLRDQLTSAFKSIWVDNEEVYESVLRFVQRFQPPLVNRVKLYTRSNPIFEEFGITAEMEKALRPKVWLKSGGYIVINQTEALVAIDVNTGKFVGKSHRLEDTIVKTNTDAIKEIVRQIRLRDLGGIIVVDFIDMDERKNRQKVMQALEEAMRADRAPYKILQFNDFGLVAITRKRVKQSLERTLCTPCPYCEGAGYVKNPQTVVGEILQEAHKIARSVEGKDVLLRVAPDVAKLLKSNQNTYLQELEEILGRSVIVKSDAQLHQEKFDLA